MCVNTMIMIPLTCQNFAYFMRERESAQLKYQIKLKILCLKNHASSMSYNHMRNIRNILNIFMKIFRKISLFLLHNLKIIIYVPHNL